MELTLINQYLTEIEASIDAGMLRAYGIDAHIETNGLSGIYPGTLVGGVALYVPTPQVAQAERLLRNHGDE
ncbi:MAG: hypothetical protein K2J92_05895 [Muribaculaceae bacterium]|nr:hypothetical protein [Bacteroides sp.]MDE6680867.1 hypothetical protein [Muribaculaceae bacterium]MDE6844039.1 hypothetical protein [Muribaculaceae bacterium]MDE7188573.1 hypothetical protein [Muribaculaceae bacterium]